MMVSNGVGDERRGRDPGSGDDMSDGGTSHGEPDATLDRAIQARIGDQLRAMYDGLMEQPVPDRFHALLARLGGTGGLEG
jgi:hypothetical protein